MSTKAQKGLGRGFDVLMPNGLDNSLLDSSKERIQLLFISEIQPNPDQPRRTFDQAALNELADSIKQLGVLQPLLVVPGRKGKHVIIAGERRWRASKIAGLEKVPAIVRSAEEIEQLEIALVENIQRVDLSPLEQAVSIQRLHEMLNISFEDIAKRLGKATSTISNTLRLLNLPKDAQKALQGEKITEGHARQILALTDYPEQQKQLLTLIIKNGWSVRQAEQFVVATKNGAKTTKKAETRTKSITPETERLSKIIKRPVSVRHMAKGGKLMIEFNSDEDLNSLVSLLSDKLN